MNVYDQYMWPTVYDQYMRPMNVYEQCMRPLNVYDQYMRSLNVYDQIKWPPTPQEGLDNCAVVGKSSAGHRKGWPVVTICPSSFAGMGKGPGGLSGANPTFFSSP